MLLYAVAAWSTWRLLQGWEKAHARSALHELWFWRLLFVGLVLLGINKQLDLQSALTEMGRLVADVQGWYDDRRQVQMAFIAGVTIMGLTLFAVTLNLTWGAPAATLWALLGSTWLVLFVVIRASSFHHVDAMLELNFSGVRLNWLLEMGGLLVIITSAWRRQGHH